MQVKLTTAFFEIVATIQIKPRQKRKSSAPRKTSKAQSLSQTTYIINQN